MTSFTSFCEMACQLFQKKQEEKQLEEEQAANAQNWKLPACYDDDDDEERSNSLKDIIISGLPPSNSLKDIIISGLPPCSAITLNEPVLSTEEPNNSLSTGDEHLDTIPATESNEVLKSSVENLIPIPSESEGIPEHKCDVPFQDNSPPLDASPPDSELISSEVMEIVISEVGGIDDDILLTIKDDILRENLLNANHLFAMIEALNDNPIPLYDPIISRTPPTLTPSGESDFFLEETKLSSTSLNSLLEETNNFDNSLPEFTTFSNVLFDAEYKSDSSDDQSCSDEDVLEKIELGMKILVTRQIVVGGRNKYLINGHLAQPSRVQNLFHSVQKLLEQECMKQKKTLL
nr:structural maintenance of chromosomes protein 2 [Tanacetum cinerariifolium]